MSIHYRIIQTIKLIALVSFLVNNSFCWAQKSQVEVMILGTAHFDEKILSDQKQDELNTLLEKLEKFKPDQILIEQPPHRDSLWHKIYTSYILHQEEPEDPWFRNNEIFQVGIKLAARLNLKNGVEGIDWADPVTSDPSKAPSELHELSYYNYVKGLRALSTERNDNIMDSDGYDIYLTVLEKLNPYFHLSETRSLQEHLLFLNDPQIVKDLYLIQRTGEMLVNLSDIGADLSGIAVHRDYKIFRNALTRMNKDSKRVLIIYGAAHAFMLKQLFDLHPGIIIVEASEHLN